MLYGDQRITVRPRPELLRDKESAQAVRWYGSCALSDFYRAECTMKKLVCLLLSIVMLLSLCTPAVFADEVPTESQEPTTFHAPTVRRMIEANLTTKNSDEEFFHLLANAYLTDPLLFLQTIEDLPGEDVLYLAKAISYDLNKTGRVNNTNILEDCNSPALSALAKLIQAQIRNTANHSLDAFLGETELAILSSAAVPLNLSSVYMGVPTVTTAEPNILSPMTLSFSVYSTAVSTSNRSFRFEIYRVMGTEETVVHSGLALIRANQIGSTLNVSFVCNQPGTCSFYVKLYNTSGTSFFTSSITDPIDVCGKWLITVELTEDRNELGTITLFNAAGEQISTSICLGRSVSNNPMNVEFGNTPIGVYEGYLYGTRADTNKFGPYQIIRIDPISGYIAREDVHRTDLRIHGGRTERNSNESDPLAPTDGCVRVLTAYQEQLENDIEDLIEQNHESHGTVIITQDGMTDLPEE